jgi:Telomere capping, CST complex subunit
MTLILESVKPEMLQSGTWLNVIGCSVNEPPLRRSRVLRSGSAGGDTDGGIVQAVLVWSAGALRIEEYERVLMQQHGAARELYTTP